MSLAILFAIFFANWFLIEFTPNRKIIKWAGRVLAFVTLFVLILSQGWMTNLLLHPLQRIPRAENLSWKQRNLIVILGIGVVPRDGGLSTQPMGTSRIQEAARLYFQCRNSNGRCQILTSGGDTGGHGRSEAEIMKQELMELGINEMDVLTETKSRNTFENAKLTAALVRDMNFEFMVLVTSGFHLERAQLMFEKFGLQARPAPSDHWSTRQKLEPTAFNLALAELALHEYFGVLQFHFYEMMGWNKP